MADVDNSEQPTPETISKRDFDGFVHQLGGTLNAIQAQQAALAERLQQATPPPAEPDLPPDFDQRFAAEILRKPRDFSKKLVDAATQQASQVFEQRLQQEYAKSQQVAAAQNFWTQFYAANPDLQSFHGEIIANFNNTDPRADWSDRANYARDIVREKLQKVSSVSSDAEQRQRAQRQLAAGAPGSQLAPTTGAGAAADGRDEYGPSIGITEEYLQQRRKQQAERRGDQLRNDREYWEEQKQLRLRRVDRQAASRRGKAA